MNHDKLAKDILAHIGGEENIQAVTHCATRLRLTLKDNQKADKDAINQMDDVLNVVTQSGQFQIVIGNQVNKVYRSLLDQTNLEHNQSDNRELTEESNDDRGILAKALDTVSGIFVPIVPALTGAGMIKALLTILNFAGWIDPVSNTYQFLNIISDASFYFLPIILAHSASVKFKTNPYISMALGGILLHPAFVSMVQTAQETGEALDFVNLPVRLVNYGSSVIPIILVIWFLSYVEPFANRIVPSVIRIFGSPLLVFLIVSPVAFVVLGPLGTYLGDGLAILVEWINGYASWLIPMLIGAFTPFIVMVGMHYALISVGINSLAQTGMEIVAGPGMLVSNIAQGGAVLGLAFKTKDAKLKSLSVSSGISAVLGITEPALYGVELQNRRTLISAMIGGGLGGLYLGVMNVVRYVQVPPSIIGLTGFIGGEGMRNLIHASIGAAIAFLSAFILQLILGMDKGDNNRLEVVSEEVEVSGEQTIDTTQSVEPIVVYSPMDGAVIPLKDVPDEVFASGALGQGVGIQPTNGRLYAPFNGTVTALFPSKHAIGLTSESGIEVLIHCGIDTVTLDGEGFEVSVTVDQRIQRGDLLLSMDLEYIEAKQLDAITLIVVTNSGQYQQIDPATQGDVQVGESLLIAQ